MFDEARRLDDPTLLIRVAEVQARCHWTLGELLVFLGEVDSRRLYAREAFSSMHAYCVRALGMSEGSAYKRITAARAGRKFPAVVEAVRDGRLHLSGVLVLAPRLTVENCGELLAEAEGKSKREVEEMVARRFPKPDVATTVRKLPVAAARPQGHADESGLVAAPNAGQERSARPGAGAVSATVAMPSPATPPRPATTSKPDPNPQPLSAGRYKVTFTASKAVVDKLEQAKALMSHANPGADMATVVERALDVLNQQLTKRRFGAAAVANEPEPVDVERADELAPERVPPDPDRASSKAGELTPQRVEPDPERTPNKAAERSRHIPAAVRALVFRRDGGSCSYVGPGGRRCGAHRFLELHHVRPFALGGEHTEDGLTLRCRAHNALAAHDDFGREHMRRSIERRRGAQPDDSPGGHQP